MAFNVRYIASYPPERCGIGTFTRDSASAMQDFTGEVNSIRIAAIDRSHGKNVYEIPVDLVIDQFDPDSWYYGAARILQRAYERKDPTIIVMQHENGLDPNPSIMDIDPNWKSKGKNYVNLAKLFKNSGPRVITLANLHTVPGNPSEHQKTTLQELSEYCDGIIVPARRALDVLTNEPYNIPSTKLKHIDHGIRIEDISSFDQTEIKIKHGFDNVLLITTLGLKSLNKGIDFGIEAYGKFLNENFQPESEQRSKILYLIAGEYHPNFIKEYEKEYAESEERIRKAFEKANVKVLKASNLEEITEESVAKHDVIILEDFLSEELLRELYVASDIIMLPYRNSEQMSSGILSDAVGTGRPVIATKFEHAIELLHDSISIGHGLRGKNIQSKGLLVDLRGKWKNNPVVNQLAEGLEYLVFNEDTRLKIGSNARRKGIDMMWPNVTNDLIKHYMIPILEERMTRKSKSPILTSENRKTLQAIK